MAFTLRTLAKKLFSRTRKEKTTVLGLEEMELRLVPSSVPLHVAGNLLKDQGGHTVVLRGVNVPSLEYYPGVVGVSPPGVNVFQSVKESIEGWHANLIRLPVNEDYWFGYYDSAAPGDGGTAYRGFVDQVIQMASDHDVYVMLDLHWSDMGAW